jgi:hypothetical protein
MPVSYITTANLPGILGGGAALGELGLGVANAASGPTTQSGYTLQNLGPSDIGLFGGGPSGYSGTTGLVQSLGEQPSTMGNVGPINQNDLASYDALVSNPFIASYLGGANTGASYAANSLVPQLQGGANTLTGISQTAAGAAPSYLTANQGLANLLGGAGASVLNTAFDPQSALYNRTQQQVTDQANAVNSQYGLGSSAAGAGVANQASENFNIDWQNQQLARQTQGLGAVGQAFGTAGNLTSQDVQNYGNLANVAGTTAAGAANLTGQIPGLYESA